MQVRGIIPYNPLSYMNGRRTIFNKLQRISYPKNPIKRSVSFLSFLFLNKLKKLFIFFFVNIIFFEKSV